MFWPREAASKMVEKAAMKLEYGDITWDSSFNLTTSYRRDSDIPRPFGNLQVLLGNSFDLWIIELFPTRKFSLKSGNLLCHLNDFKPVL